MNDDLSDTLANRLADLVVSLVAKGLTPEEILRAYELAAGKLRKEIEGRPAT